MNTHKIIKLSSCVDVCIFFFKIRNFDKIVVSQYLMLKVS